jgi:hypothetical protein
MPYLARIRRAGMLEKLQCRLQVLEVRDPRPDAVEIAPIDDVRAGALAVFLALILGVLRLLHHAHERDGIVGSVVLFFGREHRVADVVTCHVGAGFPETFLQVVVV